MPFPLGHLACASSLPSSIVYHILDEKYGGKEVVCGMRTKRTKPDWAKFHDWERRYTREKLKKLTPTERVKIVEDFYTTVLKVRESLERMKGS